MPILPDSQRHMACQKVWFWRLCIIFLNTIYWDFSYRWASSSWISSYWAPFLSLGDIPPSILYYGEAFPPLSRTPVPWEAGVKCRGVTGRRTAFKRTWGASSHPRRGKKERKEAKECLNVLCWSICQQRGKAGATAGVEHGPGKPTQGVVRYSHILQLGSAYQSTESTNLFYLHFPTFCELEG